MSEITKKNPKGAGRKRKENKNIEFSVNVHPEILDSLNAYAKEVGLSRSGAVQKILAGFFDQKETLKKSTKIFKIDVDEIKNGGILLLKVEGKPETKNQKS